MHSSLATKDYLTSRFVSLVHCMVDLRRSQSAFLATGSPCGFAQKGGTQENPVVLTSRSRHLLVCGFRHETTIKETFTSTGCV